MGLAIMVFLVHPSYAADLLPMGQPSGWRMVFQDEFTASTLDATKWVPCFPWGTTGGCQSTTTPNSTYRPDHVNIENGVLKLKTTKGPYLGTDGNTYQYGAGMVSTHSYGGTAPKFAAKYGFFEARIKVPKGKGLWPAFWLLPEDGTWPPEIDIMENLTGNTNTTFAHHMHYHYLENAAHKDSGGEWMSPIDLAADFHVYGVSWSPTAIKWYVDGVERRTAFTQANAIAAVNMYMILNLQVGGSWPGEPDVTTPFPSSFEVDYVRAWTADATVPTPTIGQPTGDPTAGPTHTPVPPTPTGGSCSTMQGDANHDGKIGIADFAVWRSAFLAQ